MSSSTIKFIRWVNTDPEDSMETNDPEDTTEIDPDDNDENSQIEKPEQNLISNECGIAFKNRKLDNNFSKCKICEKSFKTKKKFKPTQTEPQEKF